MSDSSGEKTTEELANEYAEHYSNTYVDPAEAETPIMVGLVIGYEKQVDVSCVPFDYAEYAVRLHAKIKYPGWIAILDLITGDVVERNSN